MVLSFEDGAALALRVPVPCSVLWLPGQSGTNSGLKTMETCPLSGPEARSPKWAPRQGRAPARGSGRQPPCLCQLRVAVSPRPRLRGHMTVFPLRGASLLLSLGGHQSHEDSLGSVPPDLNSVTSAGVSNFSSGPRAQAHTRAHAPTHARTCAPTRACTPTAPPLLSAHTVRGAAARLPSPHVAGRTASTCGSAVVTCTVFVSFSVSPISPHAIHPQDHCCDSGGRHRSGSRSSVPQGRELSATQPLTAVPGTLAHCCPVRRPAPSPSR